MRYVVHQPMSPFCRKVRLTLAEKGLEFELVVENVWARRADYLALNPAGQVPVFVDEDATVVCDSMAIVEFLEERYATPPMYPRDPIDRAETRRLLYWFDLKFHNEVTANIVYEKVFKRLAGSGGPNSTALRAGLENIRYHLEYIGYLVDRRNWLSGDALTVADLAAAAHLSTIDYLGAVPWDDVEPAKIWYARIKSRPSFRALLEDAVPGLKPVPSYADLDF